MRAWGWRRHTLPGLMMLMAAAPLPKPGDIVVEGRRSAVVRRQVDAATVHTPWDHPLARFENPICVASVGLPTDLALQVVDRMIEDAQALRIATAGTRCRANIFVIFLDHSRDEVERMAKRNLWIFSSLSLQDMRAVFRQTGPAQAFSINEVRSRDGERVQYSPDAPPVLHLPYASRVVTPIREDIQASVVIIDRQAVVGKSTVQIADYAAMRTFANTRPVADSGVKTILSLFNDNADPPPDLTPFDRGYLRGLYAGEANVDVAMRKNRMARSINKELAQDR